MDDSIRQEILKPHLKIFSVLTNMLVGSVFFYGSVWWKIVGLEGDSYKLRELTSEEVSKILYSTKLLLEPEK